MVGPIADSCFANLWMDPIAKPVFGYLQNEVGAGTFKPSSFDHLKPVPKRLRTLLIAKPTLATCRDFCLPGVILNDLVRLRAAIIASNIHGAIEEFRYRPPGLTFVVHRCGSSAYAKPLHSRFHAFGR